MSSTNENTNYIPTFWRLLLLLPIQLILAVRILLRLFLILLILRLQICFNICGVICKFQRKGLQRLIPPCSTCIYPSSRQQTVLLRAMHVLKLSPTIHSVPFFSVFSVFSQYQMNRTTILLAPCDYIKFQFFFFDI